MQTQVWKTTANRASEPECNLLLTPLHLREYIPLKGHISKYLHQIMPVLLNMVTDYFTAPIIYGTSGYRLE